MGVGQFFSFDPTTYRQVVSCYSDDELHREHALTRKKCLGAKASVAAGVGTALYTGGASALIFTPVGLRRNNYNSKKAKIIEEVLMERNCSPVSLRKRDVALAVGPSAVSACFGAELIMHHAHGMDAAAQHLRHTTKACDAVHDFSIGQKILNSGAKQAVKQGIECSGVLATKNRN